MDQATKGTQNDPSLRLPRILCLHGGGTNARIFKAQCRVIEQHLKSSLRLIFAEGPFPSTAGPDVLSVYSDWGPFKKWLDGHPDGPESNPSETLTAVQHAIKDTIDKDNLGGATGSLVGLLGFSQGAKLAGSLLLLQQIRSEIFGNEGGSQNFRFAVLMAGRVPITLDPELDVLTSRNTLRIPTIHVHGLLDPGLEKHRWLLESCERDSRTLVEWNGAHRLPIKTGDVSLVVDAIMAVSARVGVEFPSL